VCDESATEEKSIFLLAIFEMTLVWLVPHMELLPPSFFTCAVATRLKVPLMEMLALAFSAMDVSHDRTDSNGDHDHDHDHDDDDLDHDTARESHHDVHHHRRRRRRFAMDDQSHRMSDHVIDHPERFTAPLFLLQLVHQLEDVFRADENIRRSENRQSTLRTTIVSVSKFK
jgi:hypothetical protein